MPKLVVSGAQLQCSMGTAPVKLQVLPVNQMDGADQPIADVQCFQPMVNIGACGMCQSPSNPQVAAATAAAMGVLTPQPCVPMTAAPWSPGSTVTTVAGQAALTADSTCNCNWGGVIQITDPGQTIIDTD
jgi:hypothetical protein